MEYSKELHRQTQEVFDSGEWNKNTEVISKLLHNIPVFLAEIDRLNKLTQWVPVSERLPECKKSVFVSCISPHTGNRFTQKAVYISPKTVLADDFLSDECDCSDGIMEYDEEKDCYWVTEGWFEDSLEAEINYHITWEVTHWMTLPNPPEVS